HTPRYITLFDFLTRAMVCVADHRGSVSKFVIERGPWRPTGVGQRDSLILPDGFATNSGTADAQAWDSGAEVAPKALQRAGLPPPVRRAPVAPCLEQGRWLACQATPDGAPLLDEG